MRLFIWTMYSVHFGRADCIE